MQAVTTDEFRGSLKRLIEDAISEEYQLKGRGLFFCVDELTVKGHPPEAISLWGTLHFPSLGSPFCCLEPGCHLPIYADTWGRINDAVRHRLHLQEDVVVEMASCAANVHAGVEMDDLSTGRNPSLDWYDVDRRDMLGRTALIRAALRGHEKLVEELLAAGANPRLIDSNGRNAMELIRRRWPWIDY